MEYRYRTWPHTHLAVNRGSAKSLSLSSAAAASDRGNSQKREMKWSRKYKANKESSATDKS